MMASEPVEIPETGCCIIPLLGGLGVGNKFSPAWALIPIIVTQFHPHIHIKKALQTQYLQGY